MTIRILKVRTLRLNAVWLVCWLASVSLAEPVTIEPKIDTALADCGIQAAIDQASVNGGIVRLPEGVFALRAGLVLKSNVQLVGAGMDKTVLTPARKVMRLDVAEPASKDGRIVLKELPDGVRVGSAVVLSSRYPPSWYGAPRPARITAVDREAKTVTVEAPYGMVDLKPDGGHLIFGDAASPARNIAKGDTRIELHDASLFAPGDEIAIGMPDNESMKAHAFIREVEGNTLILTEPVQIDFPAWPDTKSLANMKINALIWALFPMVHGAHINDAAVRDLTIRGHDMTHIRSAQTRYTLSGLHLYNAKNVIIERVAVRDWPSDGFSIQTGDQCAVIDCQATGNLSNGFHPGTGLTNTVIERCLAQNNGAGLYFCWHNRGHILRGNRLIQNRAGGITGLGNPGDRNNTIEDNLIAENGGPGIEINGGVVSGNVIRNNIIRDNSMAAPGKHPGILLAAAVEDARKYTIEGNTFESTLAEPTQWVGIEEKHGKRGDKATFADENIIRGNIFKGMKTADVIVAGEQTLVDQPQAKVARAE